MGYDLCRFQGDVDEELICPVCSGVLEEPLQAPQCEHAFCQGCIRQWLSRQQTCPVDRQSITAAQLKPVPRILRNLLARLQMSCDNAQFGCEAIVKLDCLASHREACEHNPRRPMPCEQGCGLVIPKDELKHHELHSEVYNTEMRDIFKIGEFLAGREPSMRDMVFVLQDYIRAMRAANSPAPPLLDSLVEQDEVMGW
ncbi:unnamed protein product, partial [Ixodes pacificus]